ncbi:MAG: DUF2796 domain-containing protein [Burkholderiaceae bacterium]|jgi:hypothetical protein|nr:DUF2796 domain-containing protein [Aquabacterium sp.]NUP84982.1 DUF2796 domain-containing protein [Burkholderiaceae bacterium]
MHRHPLIRSMIVLAFAITGSASTVWAAGKAHEHGALKLDVAIEGNLLTISMEAPLDNLLGFERAPRTDAERKAAADVLARLRSPDTGTPHFAADAAAQCALSKAEVQAPVLEPGAKPAAKDEHAEVQASYVFTCAKPNELRTLDVGLFDAYKRTQRIDVQVAGPMGQAKSTLKRPARKVRLAR